MFNVQCFKSLSEPINTQEIQVDFEGRNPVDTDFHGIRQLLKQLLPKAPVNLSELSDVIIGQNYIGSVVTQCDDGDEDDADDDDEDMEQDANTIFGITTAINLTQKATNVKCVQELRDHLLARSKTHADAATNKQIRSILTSTAHSVGFLLNERYVNIPAQISVPLLDSLTQEIKRANSKGMAYDFAYYVMLVKFYRSQPTKSSKGKAAAATDEYYTNAEEEVFCEEALCTFEYSIKGDAAESSGGEDGDAAAVATDDSGLVPFRQLVVFEAKKLPKLIETIKKLIEP